MRHGRTGGSSQCVPWHTQKCRHVSGADPLCDHGQLPLLAQFKPPPCPGTIALVSKRKKIGSHCVQRCSLPTRSCLTPLPQVLPARPGVGKAERTGVVLDHKKQVEGHFQAKAMKAPTPFRWLDCEIKDILDHRTTMCRANPLRGTPSLCGRKVNLSVMKPLRFGGSFVIAAKPSVSSLTHQRWQIHETGIITKSLAPGPTLLIHLGTVPSPSQHVLQGAHTNRSRKHKR